MNKTVVEAFVNFTVHNTDSGKTIVRARFQAPDGIWYTAFNPAGVPDVELCQRTSKKDGSPYVSTRHPVKVSFTAPTVAGSDVVTDVKLAPRPFVATITNADEATLKAINAVMGAETTPKVTDEDEILA